MTTPRLFSQALAVRGLLFLTAASIVPLAGCSHPDADAGAATSGAGTAHPPVQLSPQQQIQQIQANPNIPDKLKKVQMGNVSGPPMHNKVGGPP